MTKSIRIVYRDRPGADQRRNNQGCQGSACVLIHPFLSCLLSTITRYQTSCLEPPAVLLPSIDYEPDGHGVSLCATCLLIGTQQSQWFVGTIQVHLKKRHHGCVSLYIGGIGQCLPSFCPPSLHPAGSKQRCRVGLQRLAHAFATHATNWICYGCSADHELVRRSQTAAGIAPAEITFHECRLSLRVYLLRGCSSHCVHVGLRCLSFLLFVSASRYQKHSCYCRCCCSLAFRPTKSSFRLTLDAAAALRQEHSGKD